MDDQHPNKNQTPGFNWYVAKRLIVAALLIILVVWAFGSAPKAPVPQDAKIDGEKTAGGEQLATASPPASVQPTSPTDPTDGKMHSRTEDLAPGHASDPDPDTTPSSQHTADTDQHMARSLQPVQTTTSPVDQESPEPKPQPDGTTQKPHGEVDAEGRREPSHHEKAAPSRDTEPKKDHFGQAPAHVDPSEPRHEDLPTGVAFVDATIASIDHELNKRFWGWRPNDIVNFTDNINNYQLGALEVTRRTVVQLAESISRTGTTDAFNPHLEKAMNWLMVKADRYWFPAPETKYKESMSELAAYKEELRDERGSFYTRTDNLIPLLSSYENLLGSCDENLVKQTNEEGSSVGLFKADDYFFYAKGVASTMATILEAVHHDFYKTLESRHATELLHHALESCRQAASLAPLLITNGDLDGIFANHRANMAAPISHARFYIGQLIKTLST